MKSEANGKQQEQNKREGDERNRISIDQRLSSISMQSMI